MQIGHTTEFGPVHYSPKHYYYRVCDGMIPSRATRKFGEVTCAACMRIMWSRRFHQ